MKQHLPRRLLHTYSPVRSIEPALHKLCDKWAAGLAISLDMREKNPDQSQLMPPAKTDIEAVCAGTRVNDIVRVLLLTNPAC